MKVDYRNHSNIVSILFDHAQTHPHKTAFIFLRDGEDDEEKIAYGELHHCAMAIAWKLHAKTSPGSNVLLLLPPGLDFHLALTGSLYAKNVAITAYAPRNAKHMARIINILANSQARTILTTTTQKEKITDWLGENVGLYTFICVDEVYETNSESFLVCRERNLSMQLPHVHPKDLAFIQYTSGSTSEPKGVMISHENVYQNVHSLCELFHYNSETTSVTWLPIFHDMGLIDGFFVPIFTGQLCVLMPSVAFIQRPVRWLRAISKYRGVVCGSPNFGYDLCLRQISDRDLQGLDLSSWTVAYNGSEPVDPNTLRGFIHKMAPQGFSPTTFLPCYGMAEATLMVSTHYHQKSPVFRKIRIADLQLHRWVEASDSDKKEDIYELTSCGRAGIQMELKIVNPESKRLCAADEIGEIWIKGPSVGAGYWGRAQQTEEVFYASILGEEGRQGPYLRSGDLGIIRDGLLFVTGRIKELIIIRGKNHYPLDIEKTVRKAHPALEHASGAAFSIRGASREKLVIVQEINKQFRTKADPHEIVQKIKEHVFLEHDLSVDEVYLINPVSLPKTSSGKTQRILCARKVQQGTLESVIYAWANGHPHNDQETQDHLSQKRQEEAIQWLREYCEENVHSRLIDERRTIPPSPYLEFWSQGPIGS